MESVVVSYPFAGGSRVAQCFWAQILYGLCDFFQHEPRAKRYFPKWTVTSGEFVQHPVLVRS